MKITKKEAVLSFLVTSFGFVLLYQATEPARQNARRKSCYSNLQQIGLALMQYANDNNNTLPRASYGREVDSTGARTSRTWMDAASPYLRNTDVLMCPSDNVNSPYRPRDNRAYGSYVMNNAYASTGDAQTPPSGMNLDKIAEPSGTVLLTDGEKDFQFFWPDAARTPAVVGLNPFLFGSIRGRHGSSLYGSAPALGCDGSCSTVLHDFATQKRNINGQNIYTALTTEND